MTDTETKLRQRLARYSDATPVSRPPLDELLSRPVARSRSPRPTYVLAGGAVVLLTTTIAGVALLQDTPDETVTGASPGDCDSGRPDEGIVASGQLDDGRPWQVEVEGEPPDVGLWPVIDGRQAGGWSDDDMTWPGMVNEGTLGGGIYTFGEGRPGDGQIVYGEVPNSAATVEVRLSDGETVDICPQNVSNVSEISYFGAYLPSEAKIVEVVVRDLSGLVLAQGSPEVIGTDADERGEWPVLAIGLTVDPDRVDLPLGGKEWPPGDTPMNHLAPVISGTVPSGEWSVLAGTDGTEVMVTLSKPGEFSGGGVGPGTPEGFFRDLNWNVTSVDGRHIVWGRTPGTVDKVVVTMDDGSTVDIPTTSAGLAVFEDLYVFGTALPEGASVTAMEGLDADGTVVLEAKIPEGSLDFVAGFEPDKGVGLLVLPPE